MSPHEIDSGESGARAIYARKPAWHRLGVVKEDGWFTAEEALAVLIPNNEPIRQVKAGFLYNGEWHEVEDYEAVIRINPDTNQPQCLSYMTPEYGVVQVVDQFRFLDEVVGAIGGAHYEASAFLRGGKQVFMVVDTGAITLDPNGRADHIKKYILGRNSYDGSMAFGVKFTNLRVECANMLAAALREASVEWTTRHTKDILNRVEAAKRTLKLEKEYEEQWTKYAEAMIQKELTDNEFQRIVEGLYTEEDVATGTKLDLTEKAKEAATEVRTIYELSPTCLNVNGTVWGGLQAVTEWVDHYQGVRGGRKSSVDEIRFRRQTGIDSSSDLKQRAWDGFASLVEV